MFVGNGNVPSSPPPSVGRALAALLRSLPVGGSGPVPGDGNVAHVEVGQAGEGGRAEVEGSVAAARAFVLQPIGFTT